MNMKKDRNCNMAVYPNMIPNFTGPMPVPMGMESQMMPSMMTAPTTTNTQNNYGLSDLGRLSREINSLEQRINRLEAIVNGSNYSTNYNSTNYQMM